MSDHRSGTARRFRVYPRRELRKSPTATEPRTAIGEVESLWSRRVLLRRTEQENGAIAAVEAQLEAGLLSPEGADEALLEIALARLDYLSAHELAELRAFGRELLEEPEMVATRLDVPADEDASS